MLFGLVCGCQKTDLSNIDIVAVIETVGNFPSGYALYLDKRLPNATALAHINTNKTAPKAIKCLKNAKCLPSFRTMCQVNFAIAKAHIVFDDERISLPYECDEYYCTPTLNKELGNKLFASKKYFVEIEFIVSVTTHSQLVKGRWYFEE